MHYKLDAQLQDIPWWIVKTTSHCGRDSCPFNNDGHVTLCFWAIPTSKETSIQAYDFDGANYIARRDIQQVLESHQRGGVIDYSVLPDEGNPNKNIIPTVNTLCLGPCPDCRVDQ